MQSEITSLVFERKKDADDNPVRYSWKTNNGYTISECWLDQKIIYQITAPKDSFPFAYTPEKKEVRKIILTDMEMRFGHQ